MIKLQISLLHLLGNILFQTLMNLSFDTVSNDGSVFAINYYTVLSLYGINMLWVCYNMRRMLLYHHCIDLKTKFLCECAHTVTAQITTPPLHRPSSSRPRSTQQLPAATPCKNPLEFSERAGSAITLVIINKPPPSEWRVVYQRSDTNVVEDW
jgi:hypothetical protein